MRMVVMPTAVHTEPASSAWPRIGHGDKTNTESALPHYIHTGARTIHSATPLHYSCQFGYKDIVQYLVEEVKCDVGECMCKSMCIINSLHAVYTWS